jgi:hypothetical protein
MITKNEAIRLFKHGPNWNKIICVLLGCALEDIEDGRISVPGMGEGQISICRRCYTSVLRPLGQIQRGRQDRSSETP